MELQIFSLIVSTVAFILACLMFILFFRKLKEANNKTNQPIYSDLHSELNLLESRINNQIDLMMNTINSQSTLISSISNRVDNIMVIEPGTQKDVVENTVDNEHTIIAEPPEETTDNRIQSWVSTVDVDKKLDSLLNGTDFTETIWKHFSGPFDFCAEKLVKYLGEHCIPLPRIEPYPTLKDNNPNFWTFIIIQAQNWKDEGRRFVIPRNFDRYDPLWHKHLFEVRGNVNKPDSFIKGLVRCAMLMNGNLSGNIDNRLVELKGIITVD